MKKIVAIHLTTVHPREDVRIFLKEIRTIREHFGAGSVGLLVMDGKGDNELKSIPVFDLGKPPKGRIKRMIYGAVRGYKRLRQLSPNLIHFHDPELIPLALLLKIFGIRIIYDVHEDLPKQILTKTYIPSILRRFIAMLAKTAEWVAAQLFDGIVTAT